MAPQWAYLICTAPRSGSTLLAEGLASTGLAGLPMEYFDQVYESHWRQRLGVTGGDDDYFDAVLRAGTTPNGVFGAKVHWYQFQFLGRKLRQAFGPGADPLALPARVFPGLRYVWFGAPDKVRQAVSYVRAIRTNRWWSIRGRDDPPSCDPAFEFEEIDRLVRLLTAYEENWRDYFAARGVEPVRVVYEDFAGDYERTVRQVLSGLGLPPPSRPALVPPRLERQADGLTEDWVRRYNDLSESRTGR